MDHGKLYVMAFVLGKSQIESLLVPGTVGTVLVNFNCCMYHVCWVVSCLLVNLCLVKFLLVCVYSVAGGWLLVAITIITA